MARSTIPSRMPASPWDWLLTTANSSCYSMKPLGLCLAAHYAIYLLWSWCIQLLWTQTRSGFVFGHPFAMICNIGLSEMGRSTLYHPVSRIHTLTMAFSLLHGLLQAMARRCKTFR